MSPAKTQKRPGRPEKQGVTDDSRDKLIMTAAHLFGERGYDSVSLREISNRADVTPALVAYYFKDKQGLMQAVLENGLNRLLSRIEKIIQQPENGSTAEEFIENYLEVINQNPWIPQILIREVLSKDTELRAQFIEQFASRAATLLPPRIAQEIKSGKLRADLDPRFTVLSIVGMCVMPYVAVPVLGPILGYEINEQFGKVYTGHVKSLFLNGARGDR